jgi:hypothetical protein
MLTSSLVARAQRSAMTDIYKLTGIVCAWPQQFAWFLGAGTSAAAGLPSAWDVMWDLKRRYYRREQNQDISRQDMTCSSTPLELKFNPTFCHKAFQKRAIRTNTPLVLKKLSETTGNCNANISRLSCQRKT